MKIAIELAFDEYGALRLLNWLAKENAVILESHPQLPLLYDSGVVYRRERVETWCDYLNLLWQGHEDCDGLAAARAGELMARGYRALRPGDGGYALARRLKLSKLNAKCYLHTRRPEGQTGLYHCLVAYEVGGRWYRDDPSARLGMYGGRIDPRVQARWDAAGVNAGQRRMG